MDEGFGMTDATREIATPSSGRVAPSGEARLPRPNPPTGQSFAVLLEGKRAEPERPEAALAPPPQPETSPRARPWQQTRYLTTAAVPKVYRQAGRVRTSAQPNSRDGGAKAMPNDAPPLPTTISPSPSSSARPISGTPATTPVEGARASGADPVKAKGNVGPIAGHKPLAIEEYPRPAADNGWGMHWIPTVSSPPDVVDRYVREAQEMGMKWMVVLNEGTQIGANDYLVSQLVQNGIMPVMRIYTPGLAPIAGDIEAVVRHYKQLGVSYFQLYNEPNLRLENDGAAPDVNRYLDVWIPAAKQVVAAGGLPGFGALSPQGEVDDRDYLERALRGLRERGEEWLLDRGWLSMHNYAGNLPLDNPDGFLRFRQYADILKQELGRIIPIVGTEAGTYVNEQVDEAKQVDLVSGAYRYMASQAEPYTFAYTYWILANQAGGGHDQSFEWQALFKRDGWVSPLVDALKRLATGVR